MYINARLSPSGSLEKIDNQSAKFFVPAIYYTNIVDFITLNIIF